MSSASLPRAGWGMLLVLLVANACSFHARDADAYRDATRTLLETKNADIQGCYQAWIKKDGKISGTVVLNFKVEPKTGKLAQVKIDPAQTTAPKSLTRCVVRALEGLVLDPPDERAGEASFRWEFQLQG